MPKDFTVRFRIERDLYERFLSWCLFRDTTPSFELRKFVKNIVGDDLDDFSDSWFSDSDPDF